MLAEEGTILRKFFLYINIEEQQRRFLERLDDPEKQWKFNTKDIEERKFLRDYQEAYKKALESEKNIK